MAAREEDGTGTENPLPNSPLCLIAWIWRENCPSAVYFEGLGEGLIYLFLGPELLIFTYPTPPLT